jgi:ATP-dependent Zn protease
VRSLLESALNRAVSILQSNRAALDEGAAALLAHETLSAEDLPKVQANGAPQLVALAHDPP